MEVGAQSTEVGAQSTEVGAQSTEVGVSIDGGQSSMNGESEVRSSRSKLQRSASGAGRRIVGCGQFGLLLSDEALGRIVRLLAHGGLANGLFVTFVDSARRSLSVGPTCVDARSIKEIPRDLSSG